MNKPDIVALLDFLRASEPLKSTLRSGYTASGRQESTAEHTWRLCLMALLLEDGYPELDMLKLLKICIVHDLGEVINGDIPAINQSGDLDKNLQERQDLDELTSVLPAYLKTKIMSLWDDYDQGSSKESQLAKALDKLETVLQHTQGKNPDDFDYGFNLSYGKKQTDFDDNTRAIRNLIDRDTALLSGRNKS
ncbi:HD domain-containing protein [Kiloniella majae]|uniref:HD domain-containing protein n=1 Tax=Kiloniella majae TaxID=1938558 RepID=UPI000A279330|nr:HD domain-containing protein [Kiloniella majae]